MTANYKPLILLLTALLVANSPVVSAQDDITPIVSIQYLMQQDQAVELLGISEGDVAGASMHTLGDINDDGYDDFAIGSPGVNNDAGAEHIIYGKQQLSSISLTQADRTILGSSGEQLGSAAANLGDINNDSIDDLAFTGTWGQNGGNVYFVSSDVINNMTSTRQVADIAFGSVVAESPGDWMGHDLNRVGDVNGDGLNDVLITSEGFSQTFNHRGKAYLIYGKDNWTLGANVNSIANSTFLGSKTNQYFGVDTADLGDINHDGYDDFALLSLTGQYRIQIFFGQSLPYGIDLELVANVTIALPDHTGHIGKPLSGSYDLNNDNYTDIILGSFSERDYSLQGGYSYGKTYIIFGREQWPSAIAEDQVDATLIGSLSQGTGYGAAGLKDINGDGYDEVITSEFTPGQIGETSAHIVLGRATAEWGLNMNMTTESYLTIYSGTPYNVTSGGFGNGVADAGDMNGDGIHEMAINKWTTDNNIGGAYLITDYTLPTGSVYTPDGPPPTSENSSKSSDSPIENVIIFGSIATMTILERKIRNSKQ